MNIKEVDYSFIGPPIEKPKNYFDEIFMDKIDATLDEDGNKIVKKLKLGDRIVNKRKKKTKINVESTKSAKVVPVV